jgi:hypothetical protein
MTRIIRIISAMLAAAVAAAILYSLFFLIWGYYLGANSHDLFDITRYKGLAFMVFITALPHAVILGLPAYLILRRLNLVNWLSSLIVGFLIGYLPVTYWLTDEITWNGISTEYAKLEFGLCGAVGGLAAWLILRPSHIIRNSKK